MNSKFIRKSILIGIVAFAGDKLGVIYLAMLLLIVYSWEISIGITEYVSKSIFTITGSWST